MLGSRSTSVSLGRRGAGVVERLSDVGRFWCFLTRGRSPANVCTHVLKWTHGHKQYTGAGAGKALPTVLAIKCGAIDRGASIAEYSQYPGEVHTRARISTPMRSTHTRACLQANNITRAHTHPGRPSGREVATTRRAVSAAPLWCGPCGPRPAASVVCTGRAPRLPPRGRTCRRAVVRAVPSARGMRLLVIRCCGVVRAPARTLGCAKSGGRRQREILWLPLSFLEPDGAPTVEAVPGGGVVTVCPARPRPAEQGGGGGDAAEGGDGVGGERSLWGGWMRDRCGRGGGHLRPEPRPQAVIDRPAVKSRAVSGG